MGTKTGPTFDREMANLISTNIPISPRACLGQVVSKPSILAWLTQNRVKDTSCHKDFSRGLKKEEFIF